MKARAWCLRAALCLVGVHVVLWRWLAWQGNLGLSIKDLIELLQHLQMLFGKLEVVVGEALLEQRGA